MSDCPIEWLRFNRRQHSYFVKLHEESKSMRWYGASSYGKIIESTQNLERWKQVSVLKGAIADGGLLRRFANANDRDEQDEILEQLMAAGKANEGRDFGSDAHRVTERYDKGLEVSQDEWSVGIVERWKAALDSCGIRVDPGLVERVVLLPELRVCATFDRVGFYRGEAHILDLKTGSSAIRYPHAACVQLALIANAEWITVGEGDKKGDSTTWTEFEPMIPVNKKHGIIVHLEREDA